MSTAVLYPETASGRKSRGYATRSVASVDSRAQRFLSNSDVCGGFRTRVTAGSGISALTVELTSLVTCVGHTSVCRVRLSYVCVCQSDVRVCVVYVVRVYVRR